MGISKKIVLIGAGGHGLVLADIAKLNGYDEIVFLDDAENKKYPYRIIGKIVKTTKGHKIKAMIPGILSKLALK